MQADRGCRHNSAVTGVRNFAETLRGILEPAYLSAESVYGASGFSGGADRWERARRPILDAIPRGGTFLDIGFANGVLMESVVEWASQRGLVLEPHGLDISEAFIERARSRLPHWRNRFYVGNGFDWNPPFRFDFVRTELVYVPASHYPDYIDRLLNDVVAPCGRLIVCSYGSSRRREPFVSPVGDWLREWGFDVSHEATGYELNGVPVIQLACVDRSEDRDR